MDSVEKSVDKKLSIFFHFLNITTSLFIIIGLMGCKNPVNNSDDSSIVDKNSPFVSGLVDDSIPKRSKQWSWSCTDKNSEDCEYRFVVSSSPTHVFNEEPYASETSFSLDSGTGTFYFHIQVRNRLDPLLASRVFSYSFILDNTPPSITSASAPANGSYGSNTPIVFQTNWSEPVQIQGLPRLQITVGSTTRYASYYSGSG
ncbi:MAG: hypothetical protein IT287_04840, partial [Bdellovibrionaceae bacterium]|nr:hypothetical protein [Pseudobdellovibrionaceae bacterium]